MISTNSKSRLKSIQLENIRGFRSLKLSLEDDAHTPRLHSLIIGRNGTCKSTLLRAIAIGLADLTDAHTLVSMPTGGFITSGEEQASIELELLSEDGTTEIRKRTLVMEHEKERVLEQTEAGGSYLFSCGYGAGRYGTEPEKFRSYRILDSVATLFDYRRAMQDTELTVRRLRDFLGTDRYEHTLKALKNMLGLEGEDQIVLQPAGGLELQRSNLESNAPPVKGVPLEGWADGFRVTFSWLLDFYGWAMRADAIDEDGHIHGILMVDEVDQHLHPSLQSEVLSKLAATFPHVQMIMTTHSPLVALGAEPEQIIALDRTEGISREVVVQATPDFSMYTAQDMLQDERLFNTSAKRPAVEEKLERYRHLKSIKKSSRNTTQDNELNELAKELQKGQFIQDDETPVMAELKRLIAKHNL